MMWANRNGFFYVLDRVNGQFLLGKPFIETNWASGIDDKGRPVRSPGMVPTREGVKILPGIQGGTNWYSPSYSPRTGLFYISTWANYSSLYVKIRSTRKDAHSLGELRGRRSPITHGKLKSTITRKRTVTGRSGPSIRKQGNGNGNSR